MLKFILGDSSPVDVNSRKCIGAAILMGVVGPEVFIVQPGFVQGLVEYLGFDDKTAGYVASGEMFGIAATTILMNHADSSTTSGFGDIGDGTSWTTIVDFLYTAGDLPGGAGAGIAPTLSAWVPSGRRSCRVSPSQDSPKGRLVTSRMFCASSDAMSYRDSTCLNRSMSGYSPAW